MRRDLDDRGWILLEVMFAIMLLTLSLIPLLGSLSAAAKVSNMSKEQTQVSFLLQKESENVKANYRGDNFESLPISVEAAVYENYGDSGFTLYRKVSTVDALDAAGAYVKHVEIVFKKDDKTYGSVKFLLYKSGI
ncbi:MAG: hypothetical protein ACYCX4_09155 [Bacillota bacterium]